MANLINVEENWTKPNKIFNIIHANVDVLTMEVLESARGKLYKIKCDSIHEWINMANWDDSTWMRWINVKEDQAR